VISGVSGSGISYIPIWLSLSSIVFATGVGVISGLLPAIRAMRLSPLAAIRNE
jgi:ABC-type antimicrobial peptide transport system permease subunit